MPILVNRLTVLAASSAKSTGGGALLNPWRDCPGKMGKVVTRDQATISSNVPNNIVNQYDVVDCSARTRSLHHVVLTCSDAPGSDRARR